MRNENDWNRKIATKRKNRELEGREHQQRNRPVRARVCREGWRERVSTSRRGSVCCLRAGRDGRECTLRSQGETRSDRASRRADTAGDVSQRTSLSHTDGARGAHSRTPLRTRTSRAAASGERTVDGLPCRPKLHSPRSTLKTLESTTPLEYTLLLTCTVRR